MILVYLGLGSNLGDRAHNLALGLTGLLAGGDMKLVKCSSVYETAPWGKKDVPPYLNAVIAIHTNLPPRVILERSLQVEKTCGRTRGVRWAARTLDIDLLLYDSATVRQPGLIVPHPYIAERAFVLVPLLELDPALQLPDGRRVAELITTVSHQSCNLHLLSAAFLDSFRGVQ